MLDFSQFEYLSFDCYGTLIDWESGILGYIRPLLRHKGRSVSDADILNFYCEAEPRQQQPPYRTYRSVLSSVMHDVGSEFGVPVSESEASGLADSIRNWQPFPDTVAALKRLKSR